VAGYNGIANLSQDGTKMIIYHFTSNVNDDLYLLDIPSGKYQKLTEDEGDVAYYSPRLMPDNKTIWLTCNNNKDGIQRLAKMTVGSPEVKFIDDGWIDPKWEIDNISFSRDYKYMAAVVNEDGYGRLRMREVKSKRVLPIPPMEGILSSAIFDKNGNCILSFNSPTYAPDVWKWWPSTGKLVQLTHSIYAGIDR